MVIDPKYTHEGSPGAFRALNVIYYHPSEELRHNIDILKKTYPLYAGITPIGVRQSTKKFDSFDEAVEFIDNLGEKEGLLLNYSTFLQIGTERKYSDFCHLLSDVDESLYLKDVYEAREIIQARIDEDVYFVKNMYKVRFNQLGYAE